MLTVNKGNEYLKLSEIPKENLNQWITNFPVRLGVGYQVSGEPSCSPKDNDFSNKNNIHLELLDKYHRIML